VQDILVIHPSFHLDHMPVLLMRNDEAEAGIEVVDVSEKRAAVQRLNLEGKKLLMRQQIVLE